MKKRIMNPNSLANLRPAKPGEIRNPKGAPRKADCLLACIKEELAKSSLSTGQTNEQLIAVMLVTQATKGNLKAVELLMSYTVSKPAQGIDLNAKGKLELSIKWDGNRNEARDTPAAPSSTAG